MAFEAKANRGSPQKTVSKGVSKASKFKSEEIIKDSDDEEEPVGTSNKTSPGGRKGVKFAPPDKFKASTPIKPITARKKEVDILDVSGSPQQSPLIQNGRQAKKQKPDVFSSLDRSKASVHIESDLMRNTESKLGDLSSSPRERPLMLNGRPPKKPKPDISGSSGSSSADSKDIYSKSDQEEGSDESQSETTSSVGNSNESQSEISRGIGRSKKSGAQPVSKNSALCASI